LASAELGHITGARYRIFTEIVEKVVENTRERADAAA
jgi:hypothetical protein